MYISECENVYFIEGHPSEAIVFRKVRVDLHGGFGQAQLKNLSHVKKQLVKRVKRVGGNCLINFEYGQQAGFFTYFFGLDNVKWFGKGEVAYMDVNAINKLLEKRS